MSPVTIAAVPMSETAIASQRGNPWRSIQENAGHSRAVMRIPTMSGMTRSLSSITSQMKTPMAAAMSSRRQA